MPTKKKICFVVSSPLTAKCFLIDHMSALSHLYDVTLVANFSENSNGKNVFPGISLIDVPITRKILLLSDIHALFKLYRVIRTENFSAVHSITPKAGLLAMLASFFAGVDRRFHTYTGQVWATKKGMFRYFLKFLDKIIFSSSSFVLADSNSQRDFLISEGVISSERSGVLASGSISGVALSRFKPDVNARKAVRAGFCLGDDAFIFLFLGRINREKGISELIDAFSQIDHFGKSAYLMLVGPEEDTVLTEKQAKISLIGKNFLRQGYTNKPENFMAAADVFCLPSHREGFGSVIIEAAATGIPSLASNIYGLSDAVDDGHTGILHLKKDVEDISKKMDLLLNDRSMVKEMGNSARKRAESIFSVDVVVKAMTDFYRSHVG